MHSNNQQKHLLLRHFLSNLLRSFSLFVVESLSLATGSCAGVTARNCERKKERFCTLEMHCFFFACVPGVFDMFTTIRVLSIRFCVFPCGQRGRAIFYEIKSVAICQIFHGYNRKFELHDCACSWLLSAFEPKTVLARNIH